MRSKLKIRFRLLCCLVLTGLLAIPVVALADQIRNGLDDTFDADYEQLPLQAGGSDGTVAIWVRASTGNGDESGCNVDPGEVLKLKAQSDNTDVATVQWAATGTDVASFEGCGVPNARDLTVKPGSSEGTAHITFTIDTNTTGSGKYILEDARFQVDVAAPSNTPPEASVTGVEDGKSYEIGSVPTAGCSVQDKEDGTPNVSPTLSEISGPLADHGLGFQTATCSYTDNGGATVTRTATYEIVDTTAPAVSIQCPTSDVVLGSNQNGTVSASDTGSGLATDPSGTVALDTSSVGANTKTVTASDWAGNSKEASCTYNVVYNFKGFFQPVDNLPTLNSVKAGSAIPVKFSLGGNQGLNVLASDYPKSAVTSCSSTAPVDAVEETVTAGSSSLSYDTSSGQYNYVWKTDKTWAGTCRQLVVKLNDGKEYRANFKFTK